MLYQVKEVAELAGVSVRTLHHYDELGLLVPEAYSQSGYRQYTDRQLERLQQIMFFKEIGFTLQEIKVILDRPGFDRKQALEAHRDLLMQKKERLQDIIETVNKTIQSLEGEISMSKEDMFKGFDMKPIEEHKQKYAAEARQKYGEAVMDRIDKKTGGYSKEDWAKIMAKADDIYRRLAADLNKDPGDPGVQQAIGEWRQWITDFFYECTPEIFRGLGDLYVGDQRFTENIDKYGTGLAAFMRRAMHIYCDNLDNE